MIPDSSIDTVRSLLQREKLTKGLLLATAAASLGTLQIGYCLWPIHNPAAVLLDFYNSTIDKKSEATKYQKRLMKFCIMIYPFGGMIGALLFGYLADLWGRKRTLVISNCVNIFGAFFMLLSKMLKELKYALFGRFVFGVGAGIMMCGVALYIIEICPPHRRGTLYMVSVLSLTFGTFVSQVVSLSINEGPLSGATSQMSLIGIVAIPNIIIWYYMPESPRYLFIQKDNEIAARTVLKKLREDDNVEEEVEGMRQEIICEKDKKHLNAVKLLSCRDLRKPLLSALMLMMGNQLTGVNGVYVYTGKLQTELHGQGYDIRLAIIVVNIILHSGLIMMTTLIDSMGRRFLLLLGFMVCSFTCVILAVTLENQNKNSALSHFSFFVVVVFLLAHMIGPGPIPYLLTGELFLQSSRGTAYMLAGFMNWFTRFLVRLLFIFLEPYVGSHGLLLFWPFCVIAFVYIFKRVPETRGRTFVEIWKGAGSPKRLRKKSSHKKDKKKEKEIK
ncbi:solute carrier family 2, facilitated glucose transporter member 7 isoform X1 [Anolis carolinensis]|uniref:solute carrier family 2, facilitated glucose transporter member 7 isoform X1 n=1 Tax=Anolis carolinensis TaxID=28377 RepID=UPI002F2B3038